MDARSYTRLPAGARTYRKMALVAAVYVPTPECYRPPTWGGRPAMMGGHHFLMTPLRAPKDWYPCRGPEFFSMYEQAGTEYAPNIYRKVVPIQAVFLDHPFQVVTIMEDRSREVSRDYPRGWLVEQAGGELQGVSIESWERMEMVEVT